MTQPKTTNYKGIEILQLIDGSFIIKNDINYFINPESGNKIFYRNEFEEKDAIEKYILILN